MELYLDLNKAAGQTASAGISPKKDPQAKRENDESYSTSHSGVMGGGGSTQYDDPKVGKKWKHDDEDSLDDKLEEGRQAANAASQKRNLTPTKEDVGIKKALDDSSMDMIKSLNDNLVKHLNTHRLNPAEIQFMTEELGHTEEDIVKGNIAIDGKNRQKFSDWLCNRFNKSLDGLYRR